MRFFSELTAKKYWIISATVLIGVFFGLYFLVSFSNEAREEKLKETEKDTQQDLPQEYVTIEVFNVISGDIDKIEGNTIYLNADAELLTQFPGAPQKRSVTVSSGTSIVERREKFEDFYKKEFAEYEKLLLAVLEEQGIPINNFNLRIDGNYGFDVPEFPEPYVENRLDLNELRVGDVISVEGQGDIIRSENIEAVTIMRHENIF